MCIRDSVRCIDIRNCVSCFRQIDVLLKNVTFDSGDRTVIIYDCDVNTVVLTLSISDVYV